MRNKSGKRALLVLLAVAVFAAPAAVVASHQFTDVPDTNVFHDDIGWLADAGVTKGCNPPTNDEFCPSDNVTREQMAAFMRRFAQYLGAEDGIVDAADNADTVDGLHADEIVTTSGVVETGFLDDFAGGTLISDTVDAPVDGYFHIVATIAGEDDCTDALPSSLFLTIEINGVATDSGYHPTDFDDCDNIGGDDNTFNNESSITVVAPVPAGQHTVEITATTSGIVFVDRRALSTLFVADGTAVVNAEPAQLPSDQPRP